MLHTSSFGVDPPLGQPGLTRPAPPSRARSTHFLLGRAVALAVALAVARPPSRGGNCILVHEGSGPPGAAASLGDTARLIANKRLGVSEVGSRWPAGPLTPRGPGPCPWQPKMGEGRGGQINGGNAVRTRGRWQGVRGMSPTPPRDSSLLPPARQGLTF